MIIGLTGGIASGKSTISLLLKDLGAYIIDADIVARNVVEKGEKAYNEIVKYFGHSILQLGGEIDRKKLGDIVFSDDRQLKKLNAITHPEIIKRIIRQADEYKAKGAKVIVIDAAVLIESGLYKYCDVIWLVLVEKRHQIHRLMERDNISYRDALKRIDSQYSSEKKIPYADVVIDNNKPIEDVEKQVKKLWDMII